MSSFHYHELEPHPELADHVLNYWAFESTAVMAQPYLHHVLPDGCVMLIYFRVPHAPGSGLLLMGPRMTELQTPVPSGARYWGVRVWPGATTALLRLPPLELRDQVFPAAVRRTDLANAMLTELNDCSTISEAARVFDAALRPRLAGAPPLDTFVVAGVRAIVASRGTVAISDLVRTLGISERQFQRRFREAVGLTPKQFARIRRLRSAMVHAIQPEPESWSAVAYAHGFADQAHLTREFSQLAGFAPTTFQERIAVIDHGPLRP